MSTKSPRMSRTDAMYSPIGVQGERNVLHPSVRQSLLEWNTERLEAGTASLDVRDRDGNVSESTTRVGVSAGISLEIGVVLGTMVVREFKNSLAV